MRNGAHDRGGGQAGVIPFPASRWIGVSTGGFLGVEEEKLATCVSGHSFGDRWGRAPPNRRGRAAGTDDLAPPAVLLADR